MDLSEVLEKHEKQADVLAISPTQWVRATSLDQACAEAWAAYYRARGQWCATMREYARDPTSKQKNKRALQVRLDMEQARAEAMAADEVLTACDGLVRDSVQRGAIRAAATRHVAMATLLNNGDAN